MSKRLHRFSNAPPKTAGGGHPTATSGPTQQFLGGNSAASDACDYTVERGDTLWDIAQQSEGSSTAWGDLYDRNVDVVGDNPDLIHPGQSLELCETPAPPIFTGPVAVPGVENTGRTPVERGHTPVPRSENTGRTEPTPVPPTAYETYMSNFSRLEEAARAEGMSQEDIMTAFRNIYYPSGGETTDVAGNTYGGGAWNILIPGAQDVEMPQSWQGEDIQGSLDYLRNNQVVEINGEEVDLGHLYAGLDARNHPTDLNVAGVVHMDSNQAAATNGGDMGSVVGEYLIGEGENQSFYDISRKTDANDIAPYFADNFSDADMHGNIDSYVMPIDEDRSLTDNMNAYYTGDGPNSSQNRFTNYADQIDLFGADGSVNGDARSQLVDDTFQSSLLYSASKGRRADIVNVMADPGPGFRTNLPVVGDIGTPTFWEMYYNNSQIVTDTFIDRVDQGRNREQSQ